MGMITKIGIFTFFGFLWGHTITELFLGTVLGGRRREDGGGKGGGVRSNSE